MNKLKFDPNNYTINKCELDGQSITYRAFEGISYCSNPVCPIQKLNIFVPEKYYEGESINGYTLNTAPIFAPNTVGGYMEGPAMKVGIDYITNKPNAAFYGLLHGYVILAAGIRGRNTGTNSNEFFIGAEVEEGESVEGKLCGRAPALIVDMKAAIRYMRHNADQVPGDVEKIITSGTSAGGALSALTGATGNAVDYEPYLKEIGACDERDDIFAANCYCPIHNLENADMAYEWLFNKENIFHMGRLETTPEGPKVILEEGELSEEQNAFSKELKEAFPAYVNSLELKDKNGNALSLDDAGEGSFKTYVMDYVLKSANKELQDYDSYNRLKGLSVSGSKVDEQDYLTINDKIATAIDFDGYVKKITRMKPVPAFDHVTLQSPENGEFGDDVVFARHFTKFGFEHSKENGQMADEDKIKCLNPLAYIDKCDTAKNWRIRHGAFDRDTSIAIPVILATMLENKGYNVDFALPWGLPHSGDYDLDELFSWIDHLSTIGT